MPTLSFHRRKALISMLLQDSRLSYGESSDEEDWGVQRNRITMPPYSPTFTDEQDRAWMGTFLTQLYHHKPENKANLSTIVKYGIDLSGGFGFIYGNLIQHDVQRGSHGFYEGADEILDRGYADALANVGELSDGRTEALLALDANARTRWQFTSDFGTTSCMSEDGEKWWSKVEHLVDEYAECKGGGDHHYELAKKIAELLEIEDDSSNPEGDGGEGEGEQQKGESNGDKGDEQSKGEGSDGEGESKGEEEGEGEGQAAKRTKDAETDYKRESIDGIGFKANETGYNLKINYSDSDLIRNDDGVDPLEVKVVKPRKDTGTGMYGTRREEVEKIVADSSLSRQIKTLLKISSQARWQGGHKRGKINKKSLASIPTGNERIFRQKHSKDVLDTSVMLVVDSSGSMSGSKYTHAVAASAMLVDCLQSLHIPVAVQGFTVTSGMKCIMYHHKDYLERLTTDELISSMVSGDVELSGNDDADALLHSHNDIIRQKTKRKVMIVLSDGQPTQPWGCAPQYLKKVVGDIEQYSPVEIYGIGIEDNSVQHFYTRHSVINDTSNLEKTLLNLLNKSINP